VKKVASVKGAEAREVAGQFIADDTQAILPVRAGSFGQAKLTRGDSLRAITPVGHRPQGHRTFGARAVASAFQFCAIHC